MSQTTQNEAAAARPGLSKPMAIAAWTGQIITLGVFAVAGPFAKFAGAPASIALFDELGAGAAGRFGVATLELVAMILLVIPRTAAVGALLAVGLMGGAIMGHLTVLGVSIPESVHPDLAGPSLFIMAVVALAASATALVIRRRQLPVVGAKLP